MRVSDQRVIPKGPATCGSVGLTCHGSTSTSSCDGEAGGTWARLRQANS